MTHGGFIWIDKKDDSLALQLSKTINPNKYKYNNTAVLQFTLDGEFVERYSNSKEAEIKNNISRSKVGECCRGKRKTAGGYIWKYDI